MGKEEGEEKKGNLYLPIFLLVMELQGMMDGILLHLSKILTKRKILSLQRKDYSSSKKEISSP